MFQDENPIPYEELYVGMEVRDNDGDCGVIILNKLIENETSKIKK